MNENLDAMVDDNVIYLLETNESDFFLDAFEIEISMRNFLNIFVLRIFFLRIVFQVFFVRLTELNGNKSAISFDLT